MRTLSPADADKGGDEEGLVLLEGSYKLPRGELGQARFEAHLDGRLLGQEVRTRSRS